MWAWEDVLGTEWRAIRMAFRPACSLLVLCTFLSRGGGRGRVPAAVFIKWNQPPR